MASNEQCCVRSAPHTRTHAHDAATYLISKWVSTQRMRKRWNGTRTSELASETRMMNTMPRVTCTHEACVSAVCRVYVCACCRVVSCGRVRYPVLDTEAQPVEQVPRERPEPDEQMGRQHQALGDELHRRLHTVVDVPHDALRVADQWNDQICRTKPTCSGWRRHTLALRFFMRG